MNRAFPDLIEITNFKSIQHCKISLFKGGKKCNILLGVNESGKSSILEALNLFSKRGEKPKRAESFHSSDGSSSQGIEEVSLYYEISREFLEESVRESHECHMSKEFLDLIFKKSDSLYFLDTRELRVKEPQLQSKETFLIEDLNDVKMFEKDSIFFLHTSNDKSNLHTTFNVNPNELQEVNATSHISKLDGFVRKIMEEYSLLIKDTVFWKPEKDFLLLGDIPIKDKTTNIPFKHLLEIGKTTYQEFLTDMNDDPILAKRQKVSETIAKNLDEFIKRFWKNKEVEFSFAITEDKFKTFVKDKGSSTPQPLEKRSDGFKHFFSFILSLGYQCRDSLKKEHGLLEGYLADHLILVDEPELHLDPASIKEFRDELLKISEDNTVIVATHSPFMIDEENVERHFHVEKESSRTKVTQMSNVKSNEVIRTAFKIKGFEIMPPNLAMLEGVTDNVVFDAFAKKSSLLNGLRYRFVGNGGVSDLMKNVKSINDSVYNILVFLDSDTEGENAKEKISKDEKYKGIHVLEVKDFVKDGIEEPTLEDLYPREIVEKAFKETERKEIGSYDKSISIMKVLKGKGLSRERCDRVKWQSAILYSSHIQEMSLEDLKKEPLFEAMEKIRDFFNNSETISV